MAGIQISGLLSNQAFDWKSVVDQLIAIDNVPITNLQKQQSSNDDKIAAHGEIYAALSALQDSLQSIRADNTFNERTVSSSEAATTWRATSSSGAPLGSYKIEVQTLASAAHLDGGAHLGAVLNATSGDLRGLTMNALPIATAVKEGTFTVDGHPITFSAADNLRDVLDRITEQTGDVTWSYNATDDTITLQRPPANGELVLGAANDSSNFLAALKLANPAAGKSTTTSSGALATLTPTAPLKDARLAASMPGLNEDGSGSFTVNGVPITYNVNTDSLSAVLTRITRSTANVTATYDALNDRVVLTNKVTGDVGVTVSEGAGGLLDALNLTDRGTSKPTLSRGTNASYRVNDGAWITNATNTLDAKSHGIGGLSVIVNTTGTQTLTVQSDTSTMTSALQDFVDKFNAVQDKIEEKTVITKKAGTVTASILSDNREIQGWARDLQQMVFDSVAGVTGSISRVDHLGIDFDGITGHLRVKDTGKFNNALANKSDDVQAFFSAGGKGMVVQMYTKLTELMASDTAQQDRIRSASSDLDEQIANLQTRLDQERESLTNSFIKMLDAQSAAQSQNQTLTNAFFKNNN